MAINSSNKSSKNGRRIAPRTKMSIHDREKRKKEASELYSQKYLQSEIAEIMGLDPTTICHYINEMHEEWQASRIDNIEEVRLQELKDLLSMERICIMRLEALKGQPHQGSRWMEERRKIKERRAKLLGLDAAQQYEVHRKVTVVDSRRRDDIVLAALGFRPNPIQLEHKPVETIDDVIAEFKEIDKIEPIEIPANANEKDKSMMAAINKERGSGDD